MKEEHAGIALKTELDDLQVEFECDPAFSEEIREKRELIEGRIRYIEGRTKDFQSQIDEMNKEIDRLTYQGDTGGFDPSGFQWPFDGNIGHCICR